MIGIGIDISLRNRGGGGVDPLAPGAGACVLTITSGITDNEPDFNIDLPSGNGAPLDAVAGDNLAIQKSPAGAGTWTSYADHTLTAQNLIDDTITVSGVSTLADADWDFRCFLERAGALDGVVSNTDSITIHAVAPVLSSPTATTTGGTTGTGAVTTDEANGILYFVVTTSSTSPSAAQVKAGQDHLGAAATDSGSQAVSTTGVQDITGGFTGLTPSTAYYAHYMHEDVAPNASTVATSASFTTEAADWVPTDLGADLALWLDADDLTTLFQLINGTTAVTTTGQSVGTWNDKSGDGFHLTAPADDTTRPTYTTGGGAGGTSPYVLFDGSNDVLKRAAAIGLLGACSVFMAVRGNPSTSRILLMEGNGGTTSRYDIIRNTAGTAATADVLCRNSASTIWHAAGTTITANAFDNTDNVYGIIDNGTTFKTYLDGTLVDDDAYTASGTNTTASFGLGAGWLAAVIGSTQFNARIYSLIIVKRAVDATERANIVTYLGAKMGRVL